MSQLILSQKLKNKFSGNEVFYLRNIIINGNKRGCSGFIVLGDNTVYVNTEVLGGGYLYRKAKDNKDYRGEVNKYADCLDSLVDGINKLLK
jgi:hypothetical protein